MIIDDATIIARRIKDWREAERLTQDECAERLGVDPAQWSRYESGYTHIMDLPYKRIQAIAAMFHRSVSELIDVSKKRA